VKRVRETSGAIVTIQKPLDPSRGGERSQGQGGKSSRQNYGADIPERILLIKGDNHQIVDASKQVAQLIIDNENLENNGGNEESGAKLITSTSLRVLVHKNLIGAIIGKQHQSACLVLSSLFNIAILYVTEL
jgi:hypothetical protein